MNQEPDRKNMKIGQLAELSGVNRSSIHHYLNLGLLPKPETIGLNIHLYNQKHLAMLREIRRLREDQKLSLTEIKERLERQDWSQPTEEPGDLESSSNGLMANIRDDRRVNGVKREQIVEMATGLFSRLGYEAVRINDITDALRMSKATFYEYFQGKEQLFMECIKRLTVDIVPREGWSSISAEDDYFKRQKLRARYFLESFPGYSGILQQTRIFSRVSNPEMAAKARETFHIMTRPLKKDLDNAQAKGLVRQFDSEIGAHMLLGLVEGIGWKLMVDSTVDAEQVLESVIDLLRIGLSPTTVVNDIDRSGTFVSAVVADIKGVETTLIEPRFDGRPYMEGKIGEALVKLDPALTASVEVINVHDDYVLLAVLSNLHTSQKVSVSSEVVLSGRTPLGELNLPLAKSTRISFHNGPTPSNR